MSAGAVLSWAGGFPAPAGRPPTEWFVRQLPNDTVTHPRAAIALPAPPIAGSRRHPAGSALRTHALCSPMRHRLQKPAANLMLGGRTRRVTLPWHALRSVDTAPRY